MRCDFCNRLFFRVKNKNAHQKECKKRFVGGKKV